MSFCAVDLDTSHTTAPTAAGSEAPEYDMHTVAPPTPTSQSSAFLLKSQDVEVLSLSEGFTILREHLAQYYKYELCDGHTSAQVEDLSRWLIVRDVLHALLVPVVELLDRAVALATCATHASKLENLENAFTGEARSAFVWLQRFLASEKEREWCYTRGCPACVVDHTLDSEYSVRLLFTSCLLSDVHYPFTIEGPTLPSFTFFLESLERALSEDPLYGRLVYERLQPKAMATRNGIEDLIQQCVELDAALRQEPSPFPSFSRAFSALSTPVLGPLVTDPSVGEARTKEVKRSKMARKHMCLPMEEECWMEEVLTETLDQLQLEGDSISVVGAPDELDAALKSKPTVCVNEIRAEG